LKLLSQEPIAKLASPLHINTQLSNSQLDFTDELSSSANSITTIDKIVREVETFTKDCFAISRSVSNSKYDLKGTYI
jgi:hypothetical protein